MERGKGFHLPSAEEEILAPPRVHLRYVRGQRPACAAPGGGGCELLATEGTEDRVGQRQQ